MVFRAATLRSQIAAWLCFIFLLTPLRAVAASVSDQNIEALRAEYRVHTRKILLAAIELERFSLNYRLYGTQRPLSFGLQYFATQEAGAAGTLALNSVSAYQTYKGRHDPEKINLNSIRKSAHAAVAGTTVAAVGAGISLTHNAWTYYRNHKRGFDTLQARRYVTDQLHALDTLLAEREAFVDAHKDSVYYPLVKSESRSLYLMREAFIYEFATFLHDVRRIRADENVFYVLNIATNVLAAASAHYLARSTTDDFRLNGPAQILLTISGAVGTVSPLISTACGIIAGRKIQKRFANEFGGMPQPAADRLAAEAEQTKQLIAQTDGKLDMGPAILRAEMYSRGSYNFSEALSRERKIMQYLNTVAAQNDLVGPAIGATALTQGILGTYAHYKYAGVDEKTKAGLDYAGNLTGAIGSGVAIGVTAAAIVADLWYMHHLEKKGKTPEQLIEDRQKHLVEMEDYIKTL